MIELESELKNLFGLAQKGDQEAYQKFLGRVSSMLRGYLLKTMNPKNRSVEAVEDLVQEVLISIHRKRDLYDFERPLLPWIYAIARHRFIDSFRSDSRQPDCVAWIEEFENLAFLEFPKLVEESNGEWLMDGLNDRQKEILRLAKIEEWSLQDIANRFSMSVTSVKVTIHRSLKNIRKKLEEKES